MTEKVVEDKVHRLTQSRKAKLGYLTNQANQLEQLMEDNANINTVKQKLCLEYQDLLRELYKLNIGLMHDDEFSEDQSLWYEPRLKCIHRFMQQGSR